VTIEATKTWNIAGRYFVASVVLSSDVWEEVEKQTPTIERMALYANADFTRERLFHQPNRNS
jgi:hypothetical protein